MQDLHKADDLWLTAYIDDQGIDYSDGDMPALGPAFYEITVDGDMRTLYAWVIKSMDTCLMENLVTVEKDKKNREETKKRLEEDPNDPVTKLFAFSTEHSEPWENRWNKAAVAKALIAASYSSYKEWADKYVLQVWS